MWGEVAAPHPVPEEKGREKFPVPSQTEIIPVWGTAGIITLMLSALLHQKEERERWNSVLCTETRDSPVWGRGRE